MHNPRYPHRTIRPGFAHGMGRLMGALPTSSQIKVGFQFGLKDTLFTNQDDATNIQNTIEGCVYSTGGFSSVAVDIQWAWYSASIYVTVAVQTANDFAMLEDVGSLILGAIQSCLPNLDLIRRDNTVGVGAADAAGNPLPQGNAPPPGSNPQGKCDWSTSKSVGDYLACQFGVSTGSAVAIGAILTLGVLFLLSRR
jgi:hypothetical protein